MRPAKRITQHAGADTSVVVGALWTWAGTTAAFAYCTVLFLAGAWLVWRVEED